MKELTELPFEDWQDYKQPYEAPVIESSVAGFCPTCKQSTNFILLRGELFDKGDGLAVLECPFCEDAFYLKFISTVAK